MSFVKKRIISFFLCFVVFFTCFFSVPSSSAYASSITVPTEEKGIIALFVAVGSFLGLTSINSCNTGKIAKHVKKSYINLRRNVETFSNNVYSATSDFVLDVVDFFYSKPYQMPLSCSTIENFNSLLVRPDSFQLNTMEGRLGTGYVSRLSELEFGQSISFRGADGSSYSYDYNNHFISEGGNKLYIDNVVATWYKFASINSDTFVPRIFITANGDKSSKYYNSSVGTMHYAFGFTTDVGIKDWSYDINDSSNFSSTKYDSLQVEIPVTENYSYDYSDNLVIHAPSIDMNCDDVFVGNVSVPVSAEDVIGTGSIDESGNFHGVRNDGYVGSDNVVSHDFSVDSVVPDVIGNDGSIANDNSSLLSIFANFWAKLRKLLQGIFTNPLGLIKNIFGAIISNTRTLASSIVAGAKDIVSSIPIVNSIDWTLPSSLALDFSPLYINLSDKFPFCIPYDIVGSLKTLSASAVAPKFTFTFDSSNWLISKDTEFSLDFSKFSKLAAILRFFILFGFLWFLFKITRSIL